MTGGDWRRGAVCVDLPDAELELAFGTDKEQRAFAASVCRSRGCPVRMECLRFAMGSERSCSQGQWFGVFGGYTASERRAIVAGKAVQCVDCGELLVPRTGQRRCLPCGVRRRGLAEVRRRERLAEQRAPAA